MQYTTFYIYKIIYFQNHNNDTNNDTCKTSEEQTVQRIMAILNKAAQQADETETKRISIKR